MISNVLTSFCMPVVWPWPILKVTVQKKRSYIYQLQFLFGCKTAFLYLYFVCHHLCNYRHHYFDHFTDCQACLEGWMWTNLLLDSPSSGALEWTSIWYVTLPQLPTTVVQYLGHWDELLFGTLPCYSSPPQWCSIWGIGMNFYLVRYLAPAPHHSGAVSGALEWTSVWYVTLLQLPTTVVQYLGHWNELLFGTLPCYSSPPQWCSIWGIGINFYLVRYLATAPHHSGAVSGALEWTSIWYVTLLQLPTTVVQYLGHWNELLFGMSPCYSSPPQWCSIWGIGMNFYLVRYLATAPHHSGAVSGALGWTSIWYVTLPQLPTTVVQYLGHWDELLFGTLPCHSSPPQWCSIWGIGMNFYWALVWTSIWYVTLPQLPTTVVQYLGHWYELLFGTLPCHSSPPQWCSIWGIGMNFYLVRYLATAPHHSGAVSGALEWTSIWYVTLLQLPTTVVQYLGHWNELLFGTLPCYSSPPQWCSI